METGNVLSGPSIDERNSRFARRWERAGKARTAVGHGMLASRRGFRLGWPHSEWMASERPATRPWCRCCRNISRRWAEEIRYGREFTEAEVRTGAKVAVVNERLADSSPPLWIVWSGGRKTTWRRPAGSGNWIRWRFCGRNR
jgi:hypothetical protein